MSWIGTSELLVKVGAAFVALSLLMRCKPGQYILIGLLLILCLIALYEGEFAGFDGGADVSFRSVSNFLLITSAALFTFSFGFFVTHLLVR
jgi:hypothetical protein